MKPIFLHEKSFFHAKLFNHHQLSLQKVNICKSEYKTCLSSSMNFCFIYPDTHKSCREFNSLNTSDGKIWRLFR
jgi:hypothetical protein